VMVFLYARVVSPNQSISHVSKSSESIRETTPDEMNHVQV